MNKLAIIGAGSSGLIALKTALDHLKDWGITCFEKSDTIQGCWGNPYPDFISTSTKYTTQFSCYQRFDTSTDPSGNYGEFFKGGEYGQYLEEFASHFKLHSFIKLNIAVVEIVKENDDWLVTRKDREREVTEAFSHVIVCTGLTEQPKELSAEISTIKSLTEVEKVRDQTVVVMGGGESAADIANRLSQPERNNTVYLSLKSGIRVSPRYHPIKGAPSDFLRNRLMLSISQNLRNKIGQKFVESRIKYQELFTKLFPHKSKQNDPISTLRKEWELRLTKAAKDNLFNMFHNKSDGFLDAVGEGRIQILGSPVDEQYSGYYAFQSNEETTLSPDVLIPATGYRSALTKLFKGQVHVKDFYLGCTHYRYDNLFLVGFARPIIGNIPSISEQQVQYIIKSIVGKVSRPQEIKQLHQDERKQLSLEFPKLNLDAIYPVEMYPYCDKIAKIIGTFCKPNSLKQWLKIQTTPATTLHYINYKNAGSEKVYTPPLLNALLLIIRVFDLRKKLK